MNRGSSSRRRGLIAAALLLAACGKLPPPPDPVRARAMALNNQADAESERGNLAEAERLYREALAAARSIEDESRVAINLLGLAATLRAADRGQEAKVLLAELVAGPSSHYPVEFVAQARLQTAVIALDEERPADAATSVERALAGCAEPGRCSWLATAHVLLARAELARGHAPRAAVEARTALDLARGRGDAREQANALRVLGDVALAQEAAPAAMTRYAEALALDKELGLGRKVAADLLGLATTSLRLRRFDEARGFAGRALTVARAAGAEDLVARAEAVVAGALGP